MFKNELAHHETYQRDSYELRSSYTCYEVYIELCRDREGNVVKNKDGSDRYRVVNENEMTTLMAPVKVKKIRDNFYKDVYEVNGDVVEKVDREGKRAYFVVDESKLVTLEAGTRVIAKNGTYRVPSEIGYALVNDIDMDNQRVVAVRKFETEDHKKEAEEIVHGRNRKPAQEETK